MRHGTPDRAVKVTAKRLHRRHGWENYTGYHTTSGSGESAKASLGGGGGDRQLLCQEVTLLRREIKQAKRTGKEIRGRGGNRHRGGTAEARGAGAE